MNWKENRFEESERPKSYEIRSIKATVTSEILDYGYLKSYHYADPRVYYKIPIYRMYLEGTTDDNSQAKIPYRVIRFGVVREKSFEDPSMCGLQKANEYIIKEWTEEAIRLPNNRWLPGWRIYGGHFIHAGPAAPNRVPGAINELASSIGCIEIINRNFSDFQDATLMLSGAKSYKILGKLGKFTLKIEQADLPPLLPYDIMTKQPVPPKPIHR
ncbi:MAG: hypothetical protein Q8942_04220 [Bacillota bacterium]|nr:hypothetical protein [Bacillota bacterium]